MSDQEFAFVFTRENCIQCHACEVACKSWRNVELGVNRRRVENIWEGTYSDVKCFSISISCMHCLEPACAAACPEEAVSKRPEDGVVVVDHEKCVGCRTCFGVCPLDVPQFGADMKMQKCDMCMGQRAPGVDGGEDPPCVGTCPTGALVFKSMDLKMKKQSEKSMTTLFSSRTSI